VGRRRLRRVIGVCVGLAFLAGVAYAGAAAFAWNEQTATDGRCSTDFATQNPGSFTALYDGQERLDATPYRFDGAVDVSVPSRTPGIGLRAWWAPPVGPETRAVIVVHGRNSCRSDPAVLLPAGMLRKAGFGVLVVDLRDHGDSTVEDGHWAGGADEWADVLGAWDWLLAQGLPDTAIGALGESMGAGAVSQALGHEARLAAAFLDSPYADMTRASAEVASDAGKPGWLVPGALAMGQLISGDPLLGRSPEDVLEHALAGRPVDIVHGTADATILVEEGIRLAEAATRGGSPVDPWILDGGRHVEAAFLAPDAYEQRVVAFFRDHLGSARP
jgi:alpha-beta hydrolase superfamily lysophospholipase